MKHIKTLVIMALLAGPVACTVTAAPGIVNRGNSDGGSGDAEPATDTGVADAGIVAPPADWGASKCEGVASSKAKGLKTGDQLAEIVVKDCDGNPVSLNAFCGASALWVFAAHGWCPHCQLVGKNAESIHNSFAGRNLASVNILVETASRGVPTPRDCKAWQTAYKHSNVLTLFDDSDATQGLWDTNSTALSVFVSRDRTIVSKSHTDVTASLTRSIEASLDK